MQKLSRKRVAVVLAPVAGFVGVGLSASPAHAEDASTQNSFVDTDGATHVCDIQYQLHYDYNGDGETNLEAFLQSFGDNECSSGFAEIDVNYEQADGDHVRVFNATRGLGAVTEGFWDNVRNVDNVPNHKINASFTEGYDSRCDDDATLAAFGHHCEVTFAPLSHGK